MTTAQRAAAATAAAVLWMLLGARGAGQDVAPAPCDDAPAVYAEQCGYYASARSFETLRAHERTSFPNFDYFIGFDRPSDLIGNPPTFVPPCSLDGLGNAAALAEKSEPKASSGASPKPAQAEQIKAARLKVAYNELATLVYRLRACDYLLSVFAWNTRRSGHDAAFDYSWRKSCNAFAYERNMGAAFSAVTMGFDDPNSQFNLSYYRLYDDLYKHVQSCSTIAGNSFYPVNTRRFFCNYAGFLGALITADATAFGRRWGGNNSLTQSQVTAMGTVLLAGPSFCQSITPAKGSKAGG